MTVFILDFPSPQATEMFLRVLAVCLMIRVTTEAKEWKRSNSNPSYKCKCKHRALQIKVKVVVSANQPFFYFYLFVQRFFYTIIDCVTLAI